MNRDIKFRGKTQYTTPNVWVCGSLISYKNGDYQIVLDDEPKNGEPDKYFVIPETVGQFVGLCDGKEIYEGDVVLRGGVYLSEVKYIKSLTGFGLVKNGKIESDENIIFYFIPSGVEVIGNIHDNPELLTKNKIYSNGKSKY